MKNILVIDDDTYICNLLVNYLQQKGYKVLGVGSGNAGMKAIDRSSFDLILCDFRLPDTDGLHVLEHVKQKNPGTCVVIMTAYAEVKMAVKLIKAGAFDYVTKPIHPEEILQLIEKACGNSKKNQVSSVAFGRDFIVGQSNQIKEVMEHIQAVAPTEMTVLIEGETGTGKEYIARAIHYASLRNKKPFVALDCGAIPKELANSELFGHIKGSFTGAINDKKGYFEEAEGGTLFLDEVGNLPYENQVRLLRAIQERTINRVGDNKIIKVDVRLIAASNDDLLEQADSGKFRDDLYHRLNGFKMKVPALRERPEDIMEFANFFIEKANIAFKKNVTIVSNDVKALFYKYRWHGNLRELQNVINRAVLLSQTNILEISALPEEIKAYSPVSKGKGIHKSENGHIQDLKEATFVTEKETITNALAKSNFNKSQAAKMLNIDRKTLYNKIKLYEIEVDKNM
ncbi:MAG: sigma-54-dependent Fis family transcriptional regulator [Bacteroidales bacterium]|nr:sigma-54-dependent Fis family transcriptional regulator [Bacteroidales bacterium]